MRQIAFAVVLGCVLAGCSGTVIPGNATRQTAVATAAAPVPNSAVYAGREIRGKATYYSSRFDGRKMANGKRFDAQGNTAASDVLPLGTVAQVTNTENGRTATVRIEDRGPHGHGRVVDLSPKVAGQLDMKHQGTARVVMKPIARPGQNETAQK